MLGPPLLPLCSFMLSKYDAGGGRFTCALALKPPPPPPSCAEVHGDPQRGPPQQCVLTTLAHLPDPDSVGRRNACRRCDGRASLQDTCRHASTPPPPARRLYPGRPRTPASAVALPATLRGTLRRWTVCAASLRPKTREVRLFRRACGRPDLKIPGGQRASARVLPARPSLMCMPSFQTQS